jgi:hypothetical protein
MNCAESNDRFQRHKTPVHSDIKISRDCFAVKPKAIAV